MTKKKQTPSDNTGDKKARKAVDDKINKANKNRSDKNAAKGGKSADADARNALRRLLGG